MSFRLRQSTRRNLSPKTSFRRTSSPGRPRASTGQSSAVSFRHRETTHNLTHRTTPELTRQTTSKPTRPTPEPSLAPTSATFCPILFLFLISLRRKNFYRDHPTNAFPSARIHLFRFIVVKFRSLLSHERPVCTLRCRRLLHFPRPSSEARGFFFARPRENVAPGPPLRPERPLPTHIFFSNPPDSRSSGPVSPKAPRAPDRFPRPSPVIPACALDRLPPRETQSRSRLPRARHLPARQLFPAIIQQRRHEPVYKRVSFLGVRAPVLETAKPQPSQ